MDFEDQLRKAANRIDYSDRDRLLRETARKSVQEFKELCLLKAQMGEHSCSLMAKTTEPGKSHLVYIYRDVDYEMAKAKGSPLPSLGEYIFLKRSEADRFLEYIREEFRAQDMRSARADLEEDISSVPKRGLFGKAQDMQSARADLEEDISSVPKRGLFGKVRQVQVSNNRYKVIMSMGW